MTQILERQKENTQNELLKNGRLMQTGRLSAHRVGVSSKKN